MMHALTRYGENRPIQATVLVLIAHTAGLAAWFLDWRFGGALVVGSICLALLWTALDETIRRYRIGIGAGVWAVGQVLGSAILPATAPSNPRALSLAATETLLQTHPEVAVATALSAAGAVYALEALAFGPLIRTLGALSIAYAEVIQGRDVAVCQRCGGLNDATDDACADCGGAVEEVDHYESDSQPT